MSLLIINGSPKGKGGNTEIFIRKFTEGIKQSCEVRYAVQDKPEELAAYLREFDTVIFAMPLYVHAMPGIVMDLIEKMQQAEGKKLGFIVQSGFLEAAQSDYLKNYFEVLCKRLHYEYLGTVVRGGAAGVCMMPEKANEKLFAQLKRLGGYFEEQGSFHRETMNEISELYRLTPKESKKMEFLYKIKLGNMMWYIMLLQGKAFRKRRAHPYSE